jgi:hypothetical protein
MTDVDQTPSDGMSATGAVRADLVEPTRTGMGAPALQRAITDHLRYSIGRPAAARRPEHYYRALALAVRDLNVLHIVALYHGSNKTPGCRFRSAPSSSAVRLLRATSWPSESSS